MKEEDQKNRRVDYQAAILIFLVIITAGIIILFQAKESSFYTSKNPEAGTREPAPNFSLPDLEGKIVNLTDYSGKVILLNIWATWCPPCVEEMPSMEKLYQELKEEEFEILAVSIDVSGGEIVMPFMKEHKLSFPVLIDPKGTIRKLYRVSRIPESIIIDKKGIIVEKIIGPRDWANQDAIRYFQNLIQSN